MRGRTGSRRTLRVAEGRNRAALPRSYGRSESRPIRQFTIGTGNGQSTGLGGEVGGVLPVLREFTAKDNVLATGAKDACEGDDVELVGSVDQRIGCQLLRVKAAWARGRRIRSSRRLLGRGLLRERQNRNA